MSADIVDVGFGVRVLHAGKDGWGVVDDAAEEADLYADMDKAILFAREIALEKAAERVLNQDAEIARLRAEVEALRHSGDVLARQRDRLDIALAEARAERDTADGARGLGERGG